MKRLGIIGLGTMGLPMARHLQEHGFELATTVRSEHSKQTALSHGITVLESPNRLTQYTDRVLIMVSNFDQCCSCLTGEAGLFSAPWKGTVIISSTIAPEQMQELNKVCPSDVKLLDAPVSGGLTGAEQRKLVTMVAGDVYVFQSCTDIFQSYSKKIVYVGSEPGQAQILKAVNQMLVGIHIVATAEALAFSEALGVDLEAVMETIPECAGNSDMFRSRGRKIINREFTSRAALETLEKDSKICMDLAAKAGVPCYLTAICHDLYEATPRSSERQEDACAVVRMYQRRGTL